LNFWWVFSNFDKSQGKLMVLSKVFFYPFITSNTLFNFCFSASFEYQRWWGLDYIGGFAALIPKIQDGKSSGFGQ
jgi:hypothetical protein